MAIYTHICCIYASKRYAAIALKRINTYEAGVICTKLIELWYSALSFYAEGGNTIPATLPRGNQMNK